MALKRHNFWNLAAVLVMGCVIIGFTAGGAFAQPKGMEMLPGGQLVTGKSLFRDHCAQCHGMDAIGNGPVAPALKKKPANLTLLSKNNGGVFPQEKVVDFIDGRKTAAAHGTREMPIWGNVFTIPQNKPGAAMRTRREVEQRIHLLVDYIKSIQVK